MVEQSRHQVLSQVQPEAFGDTFRFYLGGIKEAIVTIDPAVMQHVLKTNAENYRKSEIQVKRMGHFLGKGLLTTEGEAWKTQRRLIQKGFAPQAAGCAFRSSCRILCAESHARLRQSRFKSGPVDIYPQLMKMTFAMVARSLFGARLNDRRHRPGQPYHLHGAGVHRPADAAAVSQPLVRRLRRAPRHEEMRASAGRRADGNTSRSAATKRPCHGSSADPHGRPLHRR